MSSSITPKPEMNSASEQAGVDRPVAAARRAARARAAPGRARSRARTPGPTPKRRLSRPVRSEPSTPPHGAGAEHEPEHAGPHAQLTGRVEDEQRPEDEVEEVDRRGREQLRADDRRAPDVAHARLHVPALGRLGRRLLRVDRAHRQRREDERERVDDQRDRRREDLHEQAAEARPGDVREARGCRSAASSPRGSARAARARRRASCTRRRRGRSASRSGSSRRRAASASARRSA